MHRREALRLLATGTALQLAPGNLLFVLREARKLVDTTSPLRTLNPHQYATVKAMAEVILPKTDTPGATDVGTSEFIDLMLTEWYDEPDRTRFLNGIVEIDLHSKALFGKDFVERNALVGGFRENADVFDHCLKHGRDKCVAARLRSRDCPGKPAQKG